MAEDFEAGICRRTFDRQPHLYPSRMGADFPNASEVGVKPDAAPHREYAGRKIAPVSPALWNRSPTRVCGRSCAIADGARHGLSDRGAENRSARLATAERKAGTGARDR